ncbi:hypothetical protein RI844_08500 [Thalassotalea fonticola]|uniref:Uncharacterized protein n=1 Tax=Thalassotalea fonticola TaxID=3065649 RepID=A0ABZ0GU82_9GAMM|nr:hypothetical protein RI844_08500 [Colwelliaceae bacterium S1-1]
MKTTLKKLSEIVAKANDVFFNKFEHVDTVMGIMDKTLRKQGMNADAITIDCIAIDKKIVILIHDNKPNSVDIAVGNKEGDIFSSSEYVLNDISDSTILEIMEVNFID